MPTSGGHPVYHRNLASLKPEMWQPFIEGQGAFRKIHGLLHLCLRVFQHDMFINRAGKSTSVATAFLRHQYENMQCTSQPKQL